MPEIDGYEVCRQLKADQRTCDIPVISISALNEIMDKVTAFSMGHDMVGNISTSLSATFTISATATSTDTTVYLPIVLKEPSMKRGFTRTR